VTPATLTLACGDATARVSTRGAEWCAWSCGGREWLWSGDARWWPRHSPLLFPVVGRLRGGLARFGDRALAMPTHGFAAASSFSVVEQSADRVGLLLRSDGATRACYPFDFELRVNCTLQARAFTVELQVGNTGTRPLPYSLGLHPGFPWAGGGQLRFEADERAEVPVISAQGLFTAARRAIPLAQRRLALDEALFADEALCLLDARSRSVTLQAADGSAVDVQSRGFAHWAFWQPRGAPFLCIESWTGHGDRDDFEGDFAGRPSTCRLPPGERASYGLRYRCREPRP